jgi:hypothetical protein
MAIMVYTNEGNVWFKVRIKQRIHHNEKGNINMIYLKNNATI